MPIPTSKTPAGSQKSELQPDDVQILRLLANDFLLLSNEQIFQLLPNRPPRAINRRLERLVNAGYLSRRYPSRLFLNTTRASYAVGPEAARVPMLDTFDYLLLATSILITGKKTGSSNTNRLGRNSTGRVSIYNQMVLQNYGRATDAFSTSSKLIAAPTAAST